MPREGKRHRKVRQPCSRAKADAQEGRQSSNVIRRQGWQDAVHTIITYQPNTDTTPWDAEQWNACMEWKSFRLVGMHNAPPVLQHIRDTKAQAHAPRLRPSTCGQAPCQRTGWWTQHVAGGAGIGTASPTGRLQRWQCC